MKKRCVYIYRHDNTISIILISRKPARLNNGNVCVHDYSVHVADHLGVTFWLFAANLLLI